MLDLDEYRSSGAWLLVHLNGNILLTGATFLHYESTNVYVGELLGLLGDLLKIRYLLNRLRRTFSYAFTIYSDCLGAIQWLQHLRRQIKNKTEHSRLIRGIIRELKESSVKISAMHISAHQDSSRDWSSLTTIEKANCICDKLAKAILREAFSS